MELLNKVLILLRLREETVADLVGDFERRKVRLYKVMNREGDRAIALRMAAAHAESERDRAQAVAERLRELVS